MAAARRDRQCTRMSRRCTKEHRTQLVDLVASGDVTVPEAAARLGVTSSAAYNQVAESRKQQRPNAVRRMAVETSLYPATRSIAWLTVVPGGQGIRRSSRRSRVVYRRVGLGVALETRPYLATSAAQPA